ncbi:SIS domain-containing protein [Cohnella sp. GbtcB17]|uniref:SIS domain-containing protein n=1 Tax=Cohnella sp. GbtcB17 TaxID=2824762 RepID=UPI001C2F8E11|nr:SIS domain-containing protein [Cohnella sp. GbtcB17]
MLHADKLELVRQQIASLKKAVEGRDLQTVYFVSCGGSLATLYPGKYIMERETDKVFTGFYTSNEFYQDPPRRLGKDCLVILNSQSGGTPETVSAAKLAKEHGALTACFTTAPGSALEQAVDYPIYYYDDPVNPYPMVLSIYPEVYMMIFALLDALDGTGRAADMDAAMLALEAICDQAAVEHKSRIRQFALSHLEEPIIYTIAAGLNCSVSYVQTNCNFMESIWIHSSPLHAGEFFHGAFEAIGKDTPVFAYLGTGKTRPMEERAVKFLQRTTSKLTVLDAASVDLSGIAEWTRPYVGTLVLNNLGTRYCTEISAIKGHPMSSRRYMGVEKY